LFAVATEFAESAHGAAARGQSGHLADQDYADIAGELRAAAHNITALAEAACVIAERSAE
jgi:hypothetical protein